MEAKPTRPWFWKALWVVIVLYVIATALMIADLYVKVIDLEHEALHAQPAHGGPGSHGGEQP